MADNFMKFLYKKKISCFFRGRGGVEDIEQLYKKQKNIQIFLKVHLREHEESHNAWICKQCGKRFMYKRSLTNHIKNKGSKNCRKRKQTDQSINCLISTEERQILNVQKPFQCNRCPYRTATKGCLTRHKFICAGIKKFLTDYY